MLRMINLAKPSIFDLETPNWANWLAQDQDGTWWAYEVEPLKFHKGWYENEVGRYKKIRVDSPAINWKEQLFKISD